MLKKVYFRLRTLYSVKQPKGDSRCLQSYTQTRKLTKKEEALRSGKWIHHEREATEIQRLVSEALG